MSYQWGWAACSISRGCTWVHEIKGKLRCAKQTVMSDSKGLVALRSPFDHSFTARSSNAHGKSVGERIISRLGSPALRAYTP